MIIKKRILKRMATKSAKIKISHEVPLSLMEQSKQFNDYDYCLIHLLDKYPQYREYFLANKGERFTIMDNSAYELGESLSDDLLIHHAKEINPNILIIPDVMHNFKKTLDRTESFLESYEKSGLKNSNPNMMLMAVVQGKNLQEFCQCLWYYNNLFSERKQIQAIAFNFASPVYSSRELELINSGFSMMRDRETIEKRTLGRIIVLEYLVNNGWIKHEAYHHLLGCNLPQEGTAYRDYSEKFGFIKSMDTSNPIIHAIYGERYAHTGMMYKRPELLADSMEIPYNNIDQDVLKHNIDLFRNFWNGE